MERLGPEGLVGSGRGRSTTSGREWSRIFKRLGAGMFGVDSFTTPKLEAPLVYGVTYLYDRPSEGLACGQRGFTSLPDGIPALRAVRQARQRQQPRRQYDR